MAASLPNTRLQRISQAPTKTIALWAEGASLERDSTKSVHALLLIVASDRWQFANSFKIQGNRLMTMQFPAFRSAISRYYYSMYHACRACAFIEHQGDDYEEHSKLPLHLPSALTASVNWQSKMKDARLLRNRADYESYPKKDKSWAADASLIQADCLALLKDSKSFLTSRGCHL